jgi:bla regulator protein BlaR1
MAKLLIISVISFTIIFLLILLFRYILDRYFNYRFSYKIWYLTIIAGLIPFIPFKFSLPKFNNFDKQETNVSSGTKRLNENISTTNHVQDLTTNIHKVNWEYIDAIFTILWIVIIIVFSIKFINSLLYLNKLRKQSSHLNKDETYKLIQILNNYQLAPNIVIKKSASVTSPITFWYGKYYILIPTAYFKDLEEQSLKYIIFHEYAHAKNKDTLHLIIFTLFSIIMSYNPLMPIVKRMMTDDNEVEADIFVLKNIQRNEFKTYAETIMMSALKFKSFNKNILSHAFNGEKTLLKKRLINIKKINFKKQPKTILILTYVFCLFLIIFQSQFLMGQSLTDNKYREPLKSNYQTIDKSKNFATHKGSFVMYSSKKKEYYIYNEQESRKRYSPDSTYKIYLAMFGLDRNVITSDNSTIKWDHKNYPFASWNKNQNLTTALQNSVNWYFERISNQIPKNYTANQLNQLNYGNQNLGNYNAYWMENDLKISNLEQVIVLNRLMEHNTHFSKAQKNQLSSSLLINKNNNYALYGKTGTGIVNGKHRNGWFVGYVKTNQDTYYFSTHLSDENASGKNAESISKEILKEMGVLSAQ